ncbi:Hypothetical protein zj316_0575 [Lactiplantibacillus plantarum ZJ316]|nr:Hypothetical protein zj316_0575 [Lactiplantibacillus plantarum ZJ316]
MSLISNTTNPASQPSISRFINSLTVKNIDKFNQLLLHVPDTAFDRYN